MSGVLDDEHPAVRSDLHDPLDVTRVTTVVDWQDGFRPRGDGLLDRIWIDLHRLGFDVNEHRSRTSVFNDMGGRAEGERRGDDLISGANPKADEGEMHRRSCRRNR